MSEKKTIGKTKVSLIICVGLIVILTFSNAWFYTRIVSLQNQVSSLQTDKGGLEGQVVSLQSEFDQLHSNYVTLNVSYITLDTSFKEISHEFEELSSSYVNLTEHFDLLRQDYTSLNQTYTTLLNDFDQLSEDYEKLTSDFNELSVNYSTLLDAHQTLQEQYSTLNTLYQQLQTEYETLENTYNNLLEQYESLLELWNEPLEYVVTPTWDEVSTWLESDQTDAISYDSEKFLCGDFSIMLIQHAKALHWRMLFTVLEFDYYYENPLGIERHHGNHGHAFVSIFTTEGIVYIEPQTDFTWYLYYIGDPDTHVEFTDWVFIDFDDDWFGHIFVQYYNRMETSVDFVEDSSVSIEVGVPQ